MPKYNYHTHTYRCGHAIGEDEEYILAAIEAGYTVLGFSDHSPYRDFPHPREHMDISQFDEYLSSLKALKEKYKGQIDIRIGLESEFFEFNREEREELRSKVEYMILGQHFDSPYDGHISYFKPNSEEEILDYGESVCRGLESGLFTYLAHPDVFMNRQHEFTAACKQTAHLIASKAEKLKIPMELNVRGASKGKFQFGDEEEFFYPHKDFWKIVSHYDVDCVIGIDAHDPKDLLDKDNIKAVYDEIADLNLHIIEEPFI